MTSGAPIQGPAPRPCGSCPYRQDVPPAVWVPEEYDLLPPYDGETHEQPPRLFLCHQRDGRMCAGWVGCHDMDESLALRIAVIRSDVTPDAADAARDYVSPIALWSSGTEAAEHGRSDALPGPEARSIIAKVSRAVGANLVYRNDQDGTSNPDQTGEAS